MQNEKKLLQMIRIARFEQKTGTEDLRIFKYDRRDYVAFAMIRNFFVVTIGYGLLLGAMLLYHMEVLLDNLKNFNIRPLIIAIGAGYLFVLALYTVIVYTVRSLRHLRAKRGVKHYYKELRHLKDLQVIEEKMEQRSRNADETQEGL